MKVINMGSRRVVSKMRRQRGVVEFHIKPGRWVMK